MQRTCILWFTCTVVIYFFSSVTTIHARKCSGRWAIHACYGGNGKRSGPPSDSGESLDKNKQFILRQLLLRDRSPVPALLNNYPEDSADILEQDSLYPDTDNMVRRAILERLNSVLSDMLLNKQLKDIEDNTGPYY